MDEVTELGDMKERLMMSMLPTRTAVGGGGGGGGGGDGSEAIAGGFATLEALNDEMDEVSLSLSPCSCGEWAIISAASQRDFLNTRHFSL